MKVMHVDDEADIREIASMAMETLGGFEVAGFGSGPEALKQGPAFNPDVILLDVMMPQWDGPTTLREIRADDDLKDVPVIFMTAKVQTHEIENYVDMGVIGVLPKPFDPMSLAEDIAALLAASKRDTD